MTVKRLRDQSDGFTLVEAMLIVVIFAIIGVGGYFVAKHVNKKTTSTTTSTTNPPVTSTAPETSPNNSTTNTNIIKLDSDSVELSLPTSFESVPDSTLSPSVRISSCTKTVDSTDAVCKDAAVLVLKSEGYTNTDQFQVKVSVYDKTDTKSVSDWLGQDLGISNFTGASTTNLTIDGQAAIKYDYPQTNEDWLYYAVVKDNIGVVVYADLFSGQHYSFQNSANINYYQYAPDVLSIAQSLNFTK